MTQNEQAQKDLFEKMARLAPDFNVKVEVIHDSLTIDGDVANIEKFCNEIGIEIEPGDITE